MSDSPEVVVRFEEDGAKSTLQAVDATDKQLRKLNKQLISMSDRADMATLQAQSELYQEQVTRLKAAQDELAESMKKEVTVADRINDQLKEMTNNTALLKAQATSPEFASASRAQKEAQDALTASMEKEVTVADKVNDRLKEMTNNTALLKAQATSPEFAAAAKAQKAAQDALTDTMREEVTVADKLNDQIREMADNTRLLAAQSASPEFAAAAKSQKAAQDTLTAALGEQQSAFDKIGSFANKANEINQLAGSVLSTASAVFELGKAGAASIAVADSFDRLGGLVPSVEAMQEATAGVVDETTIQGFASLASEIGATSDEIIGAEQRITSLAAEHGKLGRTAEFMDKLLKGEVEGLRELGIVIDTSSESFAGMTEAQKKFAIFQQVAANGTQDQVDAIDGQQLAFEQSQASLDDLISTVEVMTAEFLEGSGAVDILQTALSLVSSVLSIAAPLLGVFAKGIEATSVAIKPLGWAMEGLAMLADDVVDSVSFLADLLGVGNKSPVSLKRMTELAKEALGELEQQHKDAAEAALEQSRAVGTLITTMSGTTFDFGKAVDLTALAESSTGAKTLAQSMIAAGGSFDEARIKLGELEDQMIAGFENGELLESEYKKIDEAINGAATQIDKMEAASRSNTKTTVKEVDAMTQLVSVSASFATLGAVIIAAIYEPADAWSTENPGGLFGAILYGNDSPEIVDTGLAKISQFGPLFAELQASVVSGTTEAAAALTGMAEAVTDFEAERLAEAEAGMIALGEATVFSADKLGGWGDQAGVVMSASIGLAKGLKESASGADSFSAVLSAGEAVSKGAIKDETSLAVVLGSMAAARSAMAFAGGNFVGGLGYAGASAQFFATAAMGGGGGAGGGGGGAGATTDAAQAPTAADVFEQPEAAQQAGGGGTIIYNIQSFNPDGTGEAIINHINEFAEAAGGGQIHPSLIGTGQGRSGP